MEKLVVALPKGRIMEEAVDLLRQCGFSLPKNGDLSRKLIIEDDESQLTFILAKPSDVPIYVEYGAADLGVVGKDVLLEESRDVYELLDLQIAGCRLSVAGIPGTQTRMIPRIATKFPKVAFDYFRRQGKQVEIIKLNGSIEIAPLIGLSDRIVDIVSTGRTLKENGLVEMEEIMTITSRLIANRMSYRMKHPMITHIVDTLEKIIKK
ncbi:ATP phosphoribosyltransferase [Desulfuribacillus stibiiarsenatis]|uniref:ATP phosphoribosyltransferase n=1 Tax=Desulfuribacillus stibiiarsenatis TaxID=1390249 RepID=A0A1E5L9X0_9FIRM|nr:ATP phosphoribosyltransferase [Desulfuribacillus stibiiarsenatis]OEH86809.1 ATP phosphoribosyltransferase [Desulfuribacillus stibiiarsenatis]